MAAAEATAPDYGLDAPITVKRMFYRGAWCIAGGLAVYIMNRVEYPEPSMRLLVVLGLIGLLFIGIGGFMIWSSRVGKLKVRDEMLDQLALQGEEKVLDVGCGRGLLMIGAAKRLTKTGRAVGIDTWNAEDLSGNSAEATRDNAKAEGVVDRVRVETCDARKIVYPDSNYDVVVSSLALHNLPESDDREVALREMYRVLKPGGRMAIFDILHTGAYAETLQALGAKDVQLSGYQFLWCLPSRTLTARK